MARKPRQECDAGVYHVIARGNDRRRIFISAADWTHYLALLEKVTTQRSWRTMAYCLMPNHVHLIVETVVPNLGAGMQRLQGVYAQRFNQRHGRTGHVFERRYNAKPIESDAQLQVTAAYIALNPVEAGLTAAPETWRWSSHAAATGRAARPGWLDVPRLLQFFESAGGDPARRYARLVSETQKARAAERCPGLDAIGLDDVQFATPEGDWERIHSRRASSPTRA
jgi:REP-associated tyrosine transposase